MSELRAMLDALRTEPSPASLTSLRPRPGIDQIAGLVTGAQGAGLPVDFEVRGRAPGSLSAGTSVAAHRIVQEALTNLANMRPGRPRLSR